MTKKVFAVSDSDEPVEFDISPDSFTALKPGEVPANVLIKYSEQVQAGKLYEAHQDFFERVLIGESAKVFKDRLDSSETPITLNTMIEVAGWLVEQYSSTPKVQRKR